MNIEAYKRLFVNRRDVFAQQLPSGAYMPVRRELTDDDIAEHLAGLWSIGTYVIEPEENTVTYIVFDLDTHDERQTWLLEQSVLALVGKSYDVPGQWKTLMAESSGNKGLHIWLFLSEPVAARRVRSWLDRDFWPKWNELSGGFTLEVFPKQDELTVGGFGNLVKLPFGVHAVSGKRSEIVPHQGWANSSDDVVPFPAELVPAHSAQVTTRRGDGRPSTGQPTSPFPCVDQVLREGAGKGQRNNAMFHLAIYFFGHGLDEDLALEACERANQHFDPPLPDYEVRKSVEQAYTGRYHSATCGTDWLKTYCNGPCKAGWAVQAKQAEAGQLHRAQEGSVVEVEVVSKTTQGGRTRLRLRHPDANNEPTLVVG